MKKAIILLVFSCICLSAFPQDPEFEYYKERQIKTLAGHHNGGGAYAAFYGGYSLIGNKEAVVFGGRFGWIASHCIGAGFGVTGFVNEYHYEPQLDRDVFLAGGYGGLVIEPILMPRFPVHLSFPVLIGGGGLSYISKEEYYNRDIIEESGAFLLVEPGAEIELNVTRFFRLAVGATYRFPTAFNIGSSGIPAASFESIKGMTATVSMKFGKF